MKVRELIHKLEMFNMNEEIDFVLDINLHVKPILSIKNISSWKNRVEFLFQKTKGKIKVS